MVGLGEGGGGFGEAGGEGDGGGVAGGGRGGGGALGGALDVGVRLVRVGVGDVVLGELLSL